MLSTPSFPDLFRKQADIHSRRFLLFSLGLKSSWYRGNIVLVQLICSLPIHLSPASPRTPPISNHHMLSFARPRSTSLVETSLSLYFLSLAPVQSASHCFGAGPNFSGVRRIRDIRRLYRNRRANASTHYLSPRRRTAAGVGVNKTFRMFAAVLFYLFVILCGSSEQLAGFLYSLSSF